MGPWYSPDGLRVAGPRRKAEGLHDDRRGVLHLLVAALLFCAVSVLAKLLGASVAVSQIILVRSLITVVFARASMARADIPVWGTRRLMLVLRGAFGFLALLCYFYAITHLPIADAMVIHYIHPVFTLLLAAVVLGEALHRRESLFIVGCFAGVVLITRPPLLFGAQASADDPLALGLGLLGAIISAGVYVLIRELRATEHPLRLVFYNALVASLLAAPWAIAQWTAPDRLGWAMLVGLGVCTFFHQRSMTSGLHLVRAGRATALGYVQVLLSIAAGLWLFDEPIDALGWIGAGVLAVSAALLATAGPRERDDASPESSMA